MFKKSPARNRTNKPPRDRKLRFETLEDRHALVFDPNIQLAGTSPRDPLPSSAFPAVGIIRSGPIYGTGTLITPTTVLTAAHVATANNGQMSIVLGGSEYFVQQRLVSQLWLAYLSTGNYDGQRENDIAILQLDRPVTNVTPADIVRSKPSVGMRPLLVGYGQIDNQDTGGSKHAGRVVIDALTSKLLINNYKHTSAYGFQESASGHGDSGGPYMLDYPSNYPSLLGRSTPPWNNANQYDYSIKYQNTIVGIVQGGSEPTVNYGDNSYIVRTDNIESIKWMRYDGTGTSLSLSQAAQGSLQFISTTADYSPPLLTTPIGSLTVPAEEGVGGSIVEFDVSVWDDTDANPEVSILPPSGSLFPTGITEVQVTAKDYTGKTSVKSFNVIVTDAPASGFSPPATVSVGRRVSRVATGDFNEDGYPDLVASNWLNDSIAVLINSRDSASPFSEPTYYAVGHTPKSIASGYLDSDGHLDLVVANWNDGTVGVLYGDGLGGFSSPLSFDAGSLPTDIALGDFNRDSLMDVAVTNFLDTGTITLLLNNGDGGLLAGGSFSADGPLSSSLETSDTNGDGNLDLVTSTNDNVLRIFLGDGNGNFAAGSRFSAGVAGAITAGDLNDDDITDLVVASSFESGGPLGPGNTLRVFLGRGSGQFEEPLHMSVPSFPSDVLINDFDLDGKADFAVSGLDEATAIFFGDGNGGFPRAAMIAGHAMVFADFDGSGAGDFAGPHVDPLTNSVQLSSNSRSPPIFEIPVDPPVLAVAGTLLDTPLTRFVAYGNAIVEADFTASVTWGDGVSQDAVVRKNADGLYDIYAPRTFLASGETRYVATITHGTYATVLPGTLFVENVLPTISQVIAQPGALRGDNYGIDVIVDGITDREYGVIVIDWGDGDYSRIDPVHGEGIFQFEHEFQEVGEFTIQVFASDGIDFSLFAMPVNVAREAESPDGDINFDGISDVQDVAWSVYYFSTFGARETNQLPDGQVRRADLNLDGFFDPQDVLLAIWWSLSNSQSGEGESQQSASKVLQDEIIVDFSWLQPKGRRSRI